MMDVLAMVKVCKVARVSNGVVHELANLGKRECGVNHGAIPSCVLESLMRDCNIATA